MTILSKAFQSLKDQLFGAAIPSAVLPRPLPPRLTPHDRLASTRGVGYCENDSCEDFAKGIFLLRPEPPWRCPNCCWIGHISLERGYYTGDGRIFNEVRVKFQYDPLTKIYGETAIVRDDGLPGEEYSIYTLESALIKTEKRALKVAESMLGNLNRYPLPLSENQIPGTTEIIFSFDDPLPTLSRKLSRWGNELEHAERSIRRHRDMIDAERERSKT